MAINSEEQNQRTMRAIILCVLVAIIYTQVFLAPQQKPPQARPAPPGAPTADTRPVNAVINAQPSSDAQVVGAPAVPVAHPAKEELQASPVTFVETSKLKLAVTHLGGRLLSAKLKDYRHHLHEEAPLDMVDNPSGSTLPLGVYAGKESDERVVYTLASIDGSAAASPSANLQLSPGAELVLEFKGKLASGTGITKRLRIRDDSYLFKTDVSLDRSLPEGQSTWVEWAHHFPLADLNPRLKMTHVTYLDGFGKIRHIPLTDIAEGVRDFGTSKWASLGDIYFMATLIPTVSGRNTMLGREGEVFVARVAGTREGGEFNLYVGPKDYNTLQFVGEYSLERSIDLGWFSFLAYPLLWLLDYLFLILGNYGLAIIALTLIVKTALLPLSKAAFSSMQKMQDLQPEIKALRERVKDATQLNQEIFALYQRRGVNPMGGCFPMFIQIPVFLGLYQALLNSIALRHADFALWITDLSAPEKLYILGIGVPVMVLLMAASMIIQQWTTPNTIADPVQQKMMMIMPVVFAVMFIIFPMPAGLVLYWLVNNLISITQQVYMRNTKKGSVYVATLIASSGIFAVGYILTLI